MLPLSKNRTLVCVCVYQCVYQCSVIRRSQSAKLSTVRITDLDWARESLLSFWWQDSAMGTWKQVPIRSHYKTELSYTNTNTMYWGEMSYFDTLDIVKLGSKKVHRWWNMVWPPIYTLFFLPTNFFSLTFFDIWMVGFITPRVLGLKVQSLWHWIMLEWSVNINCFHKF